MAKDRFGFRERIGPLSPHTRQVWRAISSRLFEWPHVYQQLQASTVTWHLTVPNLRIPGAADARLRELRAPSRLSS